MESKAKLFVNSPNALDGNYEAKKDTASAAFQSKETGNIDVVADEAELYAKIRELIALLPSNNNDFGCDESTDDANRLVDDIEGCVEDTSALLSRLSDNFAFYELKADTAKDMVVGFIKLDGLTVGAIANRSAVYDENGKAVEKFEPVLTAEGCYKAADFVNFCDAFMIPIVTVTNVKGYEATVASERKIAICERDGTEDQSDHKGSLRQRLCCYEQQGPRRGSDLCLGGRFHWNDGRESCREDNVRG